MFYTFLDKQKRGTLDVKKKISVVGINYFPEVTSTGLYTTEMCEFLVNEGFDVSVITGFPYYPEWKIKKEYINKKKFYQEVVDGVKIYRYKQYVPARVTTKKRIRHILSFTWGSFLNSFKIKKPDLIISIVPPTTSTIVGWILKKRFHSKLWIHVQDLEIDAAADSGILKRSSRFIKLAFQMEKFFYKSADVVSTISQGMAYKIKEKGIKSNKIVFFPNWVDCDLIRPMTKENSFRKENALVGKFIVMYAGNIGEKQNWSSVLRLAESLSKLKELMFVFIGDGAKRSYIEQFIRDRKLLNVKLFSVQPKEKLSEVLNAADVHIIPQKETVQDSVMPSKLLGIMASGKPTIAWGNENTELRRILEKSKGGIFVKTKEHSDLENIFFDLYNHREKLYEYGRNAREFAVRYFSKKEILYDFEKKIRDLISNS